MSQEALKRLEQTVGHTADETSSQLSFAERIIAAALVAAVIGLAILGLNARMNGTLMRTVIEFWAEWEWAILGLGLGVGGPLFFIWCIQCAGHAHHERRRTQS